jgi:hypothetical protein
LDRREIQGSCGCTSRKSWDFVVAVHKCIFIVGAFINELDGVLGDVAIVFKLQLGRCRAKHASDGLKDGA